MINANKEEENEEYTFNDRDISFGEATVIEGNEQFKAKARETLEATLNSVSTDINHIVKTIPTLICIQLTNDLANMLLFCTYAIGISGIKKTPEILKEKNP